MESTLQAAAVSHPNIAFIKYWGNKDHQLRIAANDSISINLGDLETRTKVNFLTKTNGESSDRLILNGEESSGDVLERVSNFLDIIRKMAGTNARAIVESENQFPTGAGIASSAAAFSALAMAGAAALQLNLTEKELSRLARRASGSASRSVPGGFVEWQAGSSDEDSYAYTIAPPEHWNLVDCIAIVKSSHKTVGSTTGHSLAGSSPLQEGRLADTPRRVVLCRNAILDRDFNTLAEVVELDSNIMHAVMQTSTPPLFYWEPQSVTLMKLIPQWRRKGLPVCYTLDAGPNVHVITKAEYAEEVKRKLLSQEGVSKVLTSGVGGPTRLIKSKIENR